MAGLSAQHPCAAAAHRPQPRRVRSRAHLMHPLPLAFVYSAFPSMPFSVVKPPSHCYPLPQLPSTPALSSHPHSQPSCRTFIASPRRPCSLAHTHTHVTFSNGTASVPQCSPHPLQPPLTPTLTAAAPSLHGAPSLNNHSSNHTQHTVSVSRCPLLTSLPRAPPLCRGAS